MTAEVAAKEVATERGDEVDQQVVPVHGGLANPAVAEGDGKEEPVDWVDDAGLGLADEGLAVPLIWVPKWNAVPVELGGLELKPGKDLVGEVGALQPGVLIGEDQFPAESNGDQQQNKGSRGPTKPSKPLDHKELLS